MSSFKWKFYYYPLCPLSQKIHWLLLLYKVNFEKVPILTKRDYLEIKPLLNFSPFPLLLLDENNYLTESLLISDYLNHNFNNNFFCINSRSLEIITDVHFYKDVYEKIIYERTLKTIFTSFQTPNLLKIQEGVENLKKYLIYFENFFSAYSWANKLQFSVGDISLFTQLMCLDYCGQMPWLKVPEIKKWYMKIKHKKEAQVILEESIGSFKPPVHYKSLDF